MMFKESTTGKYISPNEVEIRSDGKYYAKNSSPGTELIKDYEKMSKSKLNGVDPEAMLEKFGIDFTRLFVVNFVHPKSDRNFSLASDMVDGNWNLMDKVWKVMLKLNKFGDDLSQLRRKEYYNFQFLALALKKKLYVYICAYPAVFYRHAHSLDFF